MLKYSLPVALLLACCLPAPRVRAQQPVQQLEDSLMATADSMYNANIPDTRESYSRQFARLLVRTLKTPGSWNYGFEKLNGKINVLYPEDKSFRIFNWAIAPTERTRRYFAAIQLPGDVLKLYGLVDYSNEMSKGVEDSVLRGGKWFGCLYYRIMDKEVNGEKVYTMFGVNAENNLSNRKVLDPMRMTENGPVFGAPIFNVRSETTPSARVNRFVLEYKKEVQVAMNWDNDLNAIFFDKLVSQTNDPGRKYTYVPSGQVDGFRWQNGEWAYIQDVVPVAPRKDGDAPVGEPK